VPSFFRAQKLTAEAKSTVEALISYDLDSRGFGACHPSSSQMFSLIAWGRNRKLLRSGAGIRESGIRIARFCKISCRRRYWFMVN
jgi:hypothetical protein